MPNTIVETILNPKYQNKCNFKNLKDKVEMCEELKRLEKEITAQLDREHKKLFSQYTECWDKLHTELSIDAFASGIRFSKS